jgi:demethoxyubiquinone hydroxylase (CLK1/Coq7/Cat5 family)
MPRRRTRLDPLWRVAGWLLGAVPCLVGGDLALYRTVFHVESFVQTHYDEQIAWLALEIERGTYEKQNNAPASTVWLSSAADRDSAKELLVLLRSFCADETEHRHDADSRAPPLPAGAGALLDSWWGCVVGAGSVAAVRASKWI